jgi:hypothetical protein
VTGYLTTDQLTTEAPALAERDVEIPGRGMVRVRALTRTEALSLRYIKDGDEGVQAVERRMIALGMVEPAMTEAQVGAWQRSSAAAEMEDVSRTISELSGMTEQAAKEAYEEFATDPEAEFRLPTS